MLTPAALAESAVGSSGHLGPPELTAKADALTIPIQRWEFSHITFLSDTTKNIYLWQMLGPGMYVNGGYSPTCSTYSPANNKNNDDDYKIKLVICHLECCHLKSSSEHLRKCPTMGGRYLAVPALPCPRGPFNTGALQPFLAKRSKKHNSQGQNPRHHSPIPRLMAPVPDFLLFSKVLNVVKGSIPLNKLFNVTVCLTDHCDRNNNTFCGRRAHSLAITPCSPRGLWTTGWR